MDRHTSLGSWRSVPLSRVRELAAAIVLCGILVATSTRLSPLPGDTTELAPSTGGGNALRQAFYLAGVVIMLFSIRPLWNPGRIFTFPIPLAILIGWCLATAAWSIAPDVAVRRLTLMIIVVWLAMRTVDQLGPKRTADLTCYFLITMVVLNYLAVLIVPGLAIHNNSGVMQDASIVGAWRGIMSDKNQAGPLCSITIVMLIFGAGRLHIAARLILALAAMVFLIHTQSKTAIALTGFSMLVGGAFVAYNPRYRSLVLPGFVIAAAVTAYAASIYVPHFLRELAQSQDAFTGRVQIWRVLAAYIRDNPIWGCGYMSFWDVGPISPVNDYIARSWVNTSVGEGHNGYLDLWAQIGLPGLLLTLLCVVAWPIGQLLMSRTAPRAAGGMWLAIMVFVVAQNFTESTIMSPDQFTQLALMLALANMRALSGTSLPGRDVRLPSYRSRVAPAARGSADPASRPAAR